MSFRCEECVKGFKTKYKIKINLLRFHKISEENVDAIISPSYRVKCHLCDQSVLSKTSLIDHLNVAHSCQIAIETAVFDSVEGN